MRLWSLHPRYLDSRGLVALWREALLAQAVLGGRTRGYTRHPQLQRFRALRDPVAAIGAYLREVHREAVRRGYRFDASKITQTGRKSRLTVGAGQLAYEWQHLRRKLKTRDPHCFAACRKIVRPDPHPLFRVIDGGVESWEVIPVRGGPARKK